MGNNIQRFIMDLSNEVLKVDVNIENDLKNYDVFSGNNSRILSINEINKEISAFLISYENESGFMDGNYYYIKTSMEFSLIIVPLISVEDIDFNYIIIGPFLPYNFTVNTLDKPLEKYAALRAFYSTIATAWESRVEGVVRAIIRYLYDIEEPIKIEEELTLSIGSLENSKPTESFRLATEVIAKRYEEENMFLDALKKGDEKTALALIRNWSGKNIIPRVKDQIRNEKNLLITANTLYRKAVEASNVHPFYLDELSRKFALQIEKCSSLSQIEHIQQEMIQSYCKLVKKYSLSRYSKAVRESMNFINLNLSQELTLDTVSKKLGLSPAYLSGLFKKETNQTITEYIHCKRCDNAAELLVTTDLTIAEIAMQSGITDTSYFSMLFRKKYGMSPTKYRKMNQITVK